MTIDEELPFPADNETSFPTVEKIKESYHKSVKSAFDFDKVMRFCQDNRVEVLFQSDQQFHCFINFGIEKNKKPYHIDVDALSAMVFGIKAYLEEEKALIEAESFKNTNK